MNRLQSVLIAGLALSGWFVLSPCAIIAADAAGRESVLQQYDFDEYSRQPISFYYCQAGFPLDGDKPVYVWTRKEFSRGTAVLRNCDTGKTVSIPLVSHGINLWGRQDWIADCSGVRVEGNYTLRAAFGGQSAETAPFAISKNCYEDLREKAATHFFLKRCGIFCHTHDGYLYSLKPDSFGKVLGHVAAYGGWHDAHDDDKWMPYVAQAIYGLLKVQERFSPQWRGSNEPYPYCLAEAWWEVDWLLRMQKPDGGFYYAVAEWFPQLAKREGDRMILGLHHVGDQTYDDLHGDRRAVLDTWGEYAAAKAMGMGGNQAPSTAPKYFAYSAHVLRYCGRLMKPYDKKNAERCIVAASKTVAYIERLDHYAPYQELEVHAGLALYYLEEARDGGGQAALAKAEGCLKKMLAMQQPEGHFHASRTCRGLESYPEEAGDEAPLLIYPFGYMLAFTEYLEYARHNEGNACVLVDEVKRSLCTVRSDAGEVLQRHRISAAERNSLRPKAGRHHSLATHPQHRLQYVYPFRRLRLCRGGKAGRISGRAKTRTTPTALGLGANPRFMSFMNQVGVRNSGQYAASASITHQYYPMAFYRHLRDMALGRHHRSLRPARKPAGQLSQRRQLHTRHLRQHGSRNMDHRQRLHVAAPVTIGVRRPRKSPLPPFRGMRGGR